MITYHQANIEATFNNQTRLRENIKSLEKVGKNALTDRYLTDLDKVVVVVVAAVTVTVN